MYSLVVEKGSEPALEVLRDTVENGGGKGSFGEENMNWLRPFPTSTANSIADTLSSCSSDDV